MHTSTWHFWLWFGLLGVLPVAVGWGPWRKGLRVPATVYPWAVGGLLWLHGVWFDPPNNFATLDRYGFFGFWFKPVRPYDLDQHGLAMYALLSLPALFVVPMAMASLRRGQHATRRAGAHAGRRAVAERHPGRGPGLRGAPSRSGRYPTRSGPAAGDAMAQLTYQTGDATRPTGKWGKGFVMALSKRWSEPEARYRVPPIRCIEGIVCDTLVDAGVDVTVYDLP